MNRNQLHSNPRSQLNFAEVDSTNDFYPFGSTLPGRQFNSDSYEYGFNGMEKDDEIKGAGNSMTAMFWQYDTRLGRRWNLDPKPDPSVSQYAAFANNPVLFNDPFGDTVSYASKSDEAFISNVLDKKSVDYSKKFTRKFRKLDKSKKNIPFWKCKTWFGRNKGWKSPKGVKWR